MAELLIQTEGQQTDSEDLHVVIHWRTVRRAPVNNSTGRAASTAEKSATVAQLAIAVALAIAVRLEIVRPVAVERAAIDLVAEEIAAVELLVAVTHARAIDLAARVIDLAAGGIAAVEEVQIVLGVATLEAVLGIGASSKVQDPAAAVCAQAAIEVLPAWAVREQAARAVHVGALAERAVVAAVAEVVVAVVADR